MLTHVRDILHQVTLFCLGEEHVRSALEGAVCTNCERLSIRALCSHLSFLLREEGQSFAPRGSNPARAEVERRLRSWGTQMELPDEFERGVNLSRSAADEGELLGEDASSYQVLWSCGQCSAGFKPG